MIILLDTHVLLWWLQDSAQLSERSRDVIGDPENHLLWSAASSWEVAEMPLHHRDPFDRLLVAQARLEGIPILSADPLLSPYDVQILW